MKKIWWKEAVAYQVYPRSFMDSNGDGIGDLKGITLKLDYLKELGIDVVWISPFYKSPNDDGGYDISDYQAIMDEFGTMADFDELLAEAHQRGLKIIIDLVINHTSDEHPWFVESRSSLENPKRDWYIWRDGKDGAEPNNWESIFSGSAWEFDAPTHQYYLHLFSKKQPDLNWENEEVRHALYQMINGWLDKGIDGFRVDAISHIKKEAGLSDMPNPNQLKYVPSYEKHMNVEGIQLFLQELKEETFSKYEVMTVGEANGVKVSDAHLWVGEAAGKFNMVFQFEHLDLWKESVKEMNLLDLKRILTKWQKGLAGVGWNALYIENHDLPRAVSTLGEEGVFWKESAKALAVMYFLMQGTPFIYQGQEIGMTNVKFETVEAYGDVQTSGLYQAQVAQGMSHEAAMAVVWATSRGNSRTPMQWSSQASAGFSTGTPWMGVNPNYQVIHVEAQKEDPDSILNFYRAMIQLKKSDDLYTYGTYDLIAAEHPSVYAYTRTLGQKKAVMIVNLTHVIQAVHLAPLAVSSSQIKLSNYENVQHDMMNRLALRPFEARVYAF